MWSLNQDPLLAVYAKSAPSVKNNVAHAAIQRDPNRTFKELDIDALGLFGFQNLVRCDLLNAGARVCDLTVWRMLQEALERDHLPIG